MYGYVKLWAKNPEARGEFDSRPFGHHFPETGVSLNPSSS